MQVYFDKMAAFGFKSFPNQERFFFALLPTGFGKSIIHHSTYVIWYD